MRGAELYERVLVPIGMELDLESGRPVPGRIECLQGSRSRGGSMHLKLDAPPW